MVRCRIDKYNSCCHIKGDRLCNIIFFSISYYHLSPTLFLVGLLELFVILNAHCEYTKQNISDKRKKVAG